MSDEEHEERDVEDSAVNDLNTSVSQAHEQDFSLDLSTSSSIQEMSKKFKDVKSQAEKMKGKKKNAEDECLAVIGKYFSKQLTSATSADMTKSSTSEESTRMTVEEDELFCRMLAQELRKVSTPTIKRGLKRKLMDACFAAQEEQEASQLQLFVYTTTDTDIHHTGTTEVSLEHAADDPVTDAQLLLQLQNQPQA